MAAPMIPTRFSKGFVPLSQNRGKAEAVRLGILHALTQGTQGILGTQEDVSLVGYLDADLATPLSALDDLILVMTEAPQSLIVMGSRVKLLGRKITRKPHRHYLGRVFATFVSLTLDLAVYDTQCGAKVLRVVPGLSEIFATKFSSRWIFDVEILARLAQRFGRLDDKVVEVPLREWHDIGGSKLRPGDFIRGAIELAQIWLHHQRPKSRPTHSKRAHLNAQDDRTQLGPVVQTTPAQE